MKSPGPPVLKEYPEYTRKLNKKLTQRELPMQKLATTYTKEAYGNYALGSSYAAITTPLNLRATIGKRYQVTSNGTPLFEGFLAKVTHSISSSPAHPQAYSDLYFTHIEAEGFTLPGK